VPPSRVVVMGASAGGFEAVSAVLGGLTPKLQAPVLVIHTGTSELIETVAPPRTSAARGDRG